MKLMTEHDKKQTNGGIAPMFLWIIIMGVTMTISTITNTVTSIMQATHANEPEKSTKKKSRFYASKHNAGYIRMSAYPSRSTMMSPF
ncbi:MAG: hypothetical protein LBD63_03485 [Mycoplasmataceae bacterium]|jgi:hypothetical protein|nr:hypothetical protein [Mycoplasmataceae bacterium]